MRLPYQKETSSYVHPHPPLPPSPNLSTVCAPFITGEMEKRCKQDILEGENENPKRKCEEEIRSFNTSEGKNVRRCSFSIPHIVSPPLSGLPRERSGNVEHGLQLDDELPLVVADVLSVEVLEAVDAGTRNLAEELVRLLELAAVCWLVAACLDLDGYRWLTLLAHLDLLVLSFDGRAVP
jgi:hypothetical protein